MSLLLRREDSDLKNFGLKVQLPASIRSFCFFGQVTKGNNYRHYSFVLNCWGVVHLEYGVVCEGWCEMVIEKAYNYVIQGSLSTRLRRWDMIQVDEVDYTPSCIWLASVFFACCAAFRFMLTILNLRKREILSYKALLCSNSFHMFIFLNCAALSLSLSHHVSSYLSHTFRL